MSNQSTIKEWTTVAIRQTRLDKIAKLRKTHPEFDSDAGVVDQAVLNFLDKYEGIRK